jgi:polyisoprenoid-binding protein YceI
MKNVLMIVGLMALGFTATAQKWSVDKAHSKVGFSVVHLMLSDVEGSFKISDATLTASKDDFTDAQFELTADVNSVFTEQERRDTHLKSPDFFDAAKFSSITFKSNSFKKVADRKYKLTGELTMHGVTKLVTLDGTLNGVSTNKAGKKIAGFKFTGTLNRTAFGVGSMPAAVVGEEIELKANGEFVQN